MASLKVKIINILKIFLIEFFNYWNIKGIRYKLTEQAIRNKLIDEMNDEMRNDYTDEHVEYVTECQANYAVPGFVHQPPKPTTVKLL